MLIVILAFTFVWISRVIGDGGVDDISETEMKKKILKNYDKTIAPILYSKQSHRNTVGFILKRIRDLDEEKCELITEQVAYFYWRDSRLEFDLKSVRFKSIRAAADEIWTPTLNVLNRLQPDEKTLEPTVIIVSSGIFWFPRYVLRTYCSPNLRFYPFDEQSCDIEVAGITQQGEFLALNYTPVDISSYGFFTSRLTKNIRWRFLSTSKKQRTETFLPGIEATIEVFTIIMRRTMPMIALCLLTPGIIGVVLLLATFWIKPGNSIRVGINLTSMLICSSSLFTLGKCLPATGKVTPIIVEYATTALILTTLSTLQAMVVSVLVRMAHPPDVSYLKFKLVFPPWILKMLCVTPFTSSDNSTDQTFLFSELVENNVAQETSSDLDAKPRTERSSNSENEWKNIITLFERLIFYVYVIVVLLFITSVMINE